MSVLHLIQWIVAYWLTGWEIGEDYLSKQKCRVPQGYIFGEKQQYILPQLCRWYSDLHFFINRWPWGDKPTQKNSNVRDRRRTSPGCAHAETPTHCLSLPIRVQRSTVWKAALRSSNTKTEHSPTSEDIMPSLETEKSRFSGMLLTETRLELSKNVVCIQNSGELFGKNMFKIQWDT